MKNLLQEISAQDAYAKFYADIPEDDFNSIVNAAGMNKMCKTLTLLLNAVKTQEIGVQQAIDTLSAIKVQGPTAIKSADNLISTGKVQTAQELIAYINNNELIAKTHIQRSENGLVVLFEDERGCLTCTLTYEANKHYFGGKTQWCTASDREGRFNGCLMFGRYANITSIFDSDCEIFDSIPVADIEFKTNEELAEICCIQFNVKFDDYFLLGTQRRGLVYVLNTLNNIPKEDCTPLFQFDTKKGKIYQFTYSSYDDFYICNEKDTQIDFDCFCEEINFTEKEFTNLLDTIDVQSLADKTYTYYIKYDFKFEQEKGRKFWEQENLCSTENARLIQTFTNNLDIDIIRNAENIIAEEQKSIQKEIYQKLIDCGNAEYLANELEKSYSVQNDDLNPVLLSENDLKNTQHIQLVYNRISRQLWSQNFYTTLGYTAGDNYGKLYRAFKSHYKLNKWLKENMGKTPMFIKHNPYFKAIIKIVDNKPYIIQSYD